MPQARTRAPAVFCVAPSERPPVHWIKPTRLRCFSQIVFFLLFLLPSAADGVPRIACMPPGATSALPYPVRLFFQLDPLVALSNALARHALYHGLSVEPGGADSHPVSGRFFCGWICPMGSIHHFFSSLKSERKRGKQLIESNRYKRWQTAKYYILCRAACSSGLRHGDCRMVRSFFAAGALAGFVDSAGNQLRSDGAVLGALEHSRSVRADGRQRAALHLRRPAAQLQAAVFPAGDLARADLHFSVALNLRVTRFWCRALCPLGALLGVVSRWSVLGLVKKPEHCNDCNRCLMHCQGGDDPIGGVPWRKPSAISASTASTIARTTRLPSKFFPRQEFVAGQTCGGASCSPDWLPARPRAAGAQHPRICRRAP